MIVASALPATWRKSSYSSTNGGNCIEVGEGLPGLAPVRDSKNPHGPALLFTTEAVSSFVAAVKSGEFTRTRALPVTWRKASYSSSNGGNCIEVGEGLPGLAPVRDSKDPHGPALLFTADALASFVAGVKSGDFPLI